MTEENGRKEFRLSRRGFLKLSGAAVAAVAASMAFDNLVFLQSIEDVDNPLAFYPNRDWESIYRDQFRADYDFSFVCAPNDTHNCRLRAFVRNGIITRIEQPYDVSEYKVAWQQGNRYMAPQRLS